MSTTVSCVKVNHIRPTYSDLRMWMNDVKNLYIARKGVVFVTNLDGSKMRYPPTDSLWANPFKISNTCPRNQAVEQYENYIRYKIQCDPYTYNLNILIGKNLGCWCEPGELCHGHILLKLLKEKELI